MSETNGPLVVDAKLAVSLLPADFTKQVSVACKTEMQQRQHPTLQFNDLFNQLSARMPLVRFLAAVKALLFIAHTTEHSQQGLQFGFPEPASMEKVLRTCNNSEQLSADLATLAGLLKSSGNEELLGQFTTFQQQAVAYLSKHGSELQTATEKALEASATIETPANRSAFGG